MASISLQTTKSGLQVSLKAQENIRDAYNKIYEAQKAPYIKKLQDIALNAGGSSLAVNAFDIIKATTEAQKAIKEINAEQYQKVQPINDTIEDVKKGIAKIDESIAAQEEFYKIQETQKRILADIKKAEEENAQKAATQKRNRYLLYAGGAVVLYLLVRK